MVNRGEQPVEWLMNREVKTLSLKLNSNKKENPTITEIKAAIAELEGIRKFFDTADPELIDYAIYMEKAAICRLSYLFRKAKTEASNNVIHHA